MMAPLIDLADARARLRAGSPKLGLLRARVEVDRVCLEFDTPVRCFNLSPGQARFWGNALLTLADAADRGKR